MCGRFTLSQTSEAIANHFRLAEVPNLPPRYNIAPTQPVAAIVLDDQEHRRCQRNLPFGLLLSVDYV
jgi:putative SOS response-associated peptidase YedK